MHDWRRKKDDPKTLRCRRCGNELPNNPAGRSIALENRGACYTPQERAAQAERDAAADAVDDEIDLLKERVRLGELTVEAAEALLSDAARAELARRERHRKTRDLMYAAALVGTGVRY